MKYYFCGIGGIGMSSIALYLKFKGHVVSGSDRAFDLNDNLKMKERLERDDIILFHQDGSGITSDTDFVVTSTAVEDKIPDIQKAKQLGIPVKRRAEILAEILHSYLGIAIGGTSGKTTITAMTGHILKQTGADPVVINGGIFINEYDNKAASNLIFGKGAYCVVESDESDGTIELYSPAICVVSNISLDHKPIPELKVLFENFIKRTKQGAVVNLDCSYTAELKDIHPNTITFSCDERKHATLTATDIQKTRDGVSFNVNGIGVLLQVAGLHNVQNALAAMAACQIAGVSLAQSAQALASFKGTKRRLEKIGTADKIAVFDDYAHNPEKVAATLRTLANAPHRLWSIFQPHGFTPTRLMKDNLIQAFVQNTTSEDKLIFPEIFYQGGTVAKDISSKDIVEALNAQNRQAFFFGNRSDIPDFIAPNIQTEDTVVVMGARDGTLSDLAKEILKKIKEK